jgi:Flp pilus assembly protein TadD
LARYRLPVLPPLFILAAVGIIRLKDQLHKGAYSRLALAAVIILITAGVSFRGYDKRNAGFAQGFTNLAAIHVHNGNLAEAIAAYGRALKENPKNANTHRDLGVIYARQGKASLAEQALTKSVRLNPKHPDAWLYLGKLYDRLGKFEHAKGAYRHALKNRPANAEAAFNLATDEQRGGNYQAAVAIYQQMQKLHPKDVRIIHNLSIAYFYAGKLELARQNAELSASRGRALPPKFLQELKKAEAAQRNRAPQK